jgi:hypothetical protein
MGFERYYQISIPSNQIIIQTFTGQAKVEFLQKKKKQKKAKVQ